MLHIKDLRFSLGGKLLFDGASAHVPAGAKVGLVGRNGAGKSTLLGLIAGDHAPDGGAVSLRPRARIGRLAQEAPSGPASLIETVLAADETLTTLKARLASETDPCAIAEIHAQLADIGAASAEARAGAILAGLGFDAAAQGRPLDAFSGGWRMRIALASVLFTTPDLLLLDEPTNYLDLEGAIWLENFLKTYPHTLVMVSHDRDMLNAVAGTILLVEGGRLAVYRGNYDRFARTRAEAKARQEKTRAKTASERRRIAAFIDRFRAKASKARQAQSRLKMLARMAADAPLYHEEEISLHFPDPEPLPPPLITLEGASAGYGGKAVLDKLSLVLDMDDRIALLGPNGAGKSTFAKVLAGRLKPLAGGMVKPAKLRAGYFAQHQLEALTADETPYQHMARLMPEAGEARVRARLGGFGFSADKANRSVATLSGGEKARLLFCLISHDRPHLLILDEPTNHLDIEARAALMDALNAYAGAVILISHDRTLIDACAERLWLVAEGTVKAFDGDMDDYVARILSERRASNGAAKPGKAAASAKDARRLAAEARQRLAPFRRRVEALEKALARLGAEQARLEAILADPALYDGTADKVARLTGLRQEEAALKSRIAAAETAWLDAQQELEDAAQG
ncbi:MAG: ABC-F family ATP-binding cassette domain-containing protein [Pseudomonadota bacterium]